MKTTPAVTKAIKISTASADATEFYILLPSSEHERYAMTTIGK